MEFSGSYFIYSGTSSKQYGLIFANVETSRFGKISGEIKNNSIFNKRDKRNYIIGEDFSDSSVQFEAEIVTDDDRVIDLVQRREIEKWLFHQPSYRKLYTEPECDAFSDTYEFVDGVEKRLYLNCRFVNAEKIEGNGGIIGYRFTVECDSPMAWQDPMFYTYTINNASSSSNSTITIPVDSDIRDYIYPKVTLTIGSSGGDISISNITDDSIRVTAFTGLSPNITVIMRGDGVNYISGNYYQKFSQKNFIRLLDGDNTLSITGNIVKVEVEFNNRRYI